MMKKLNKKGAIPIGEAFQIVWDTIPRPLKAFLFIFFIVILSSFVIPSIIKLFGYECAVDNTGQINLYKVPTENLLRGAILSFNGIVNRYILGVDEYRMDDDPFPLGDKRYWDIPDECFVETEINGTPIIGYTAQCSNCSFEPKWLFGVFGSTKDSICVDDGYYEEGSYINKNPVLTSFCYQCSPPNIEQCDTEYYFNISNCPNPPYECYFTLKNESQASCVTANVKSDYYDKILKLNGVKIPQSSDEFINVQCVEEGKPSLYMFTIELFNRTMWIILIIGGLLVPLFWGYYNVVLK